MMATLVSKVQLLRDLRALQEEAKAEELKRQESLMQSTSKVRGGMIVSETKTERRKSCTGRMVHFDAVLRQVNSTPPQTIVGGKLDHSS